MTNGEPELSPAEQMRQQRLQRNLKILVSTLGILIIAALGAVVFKFLTLSSSTRDTAAPAPQGRNIGGEIAFEIPRSAKVVSVSLSGDRLAIHHDGPAGVGIAVVDIETGRRIADIKPIEAVPRD
jgi:hypothetical protein